MWQLLDFPRLWLTKLFIGDQEIILCIDETGDKKKGKSTDYTARQYIGNLGKTENGIVSVNAYGVVEGLTYPLMFKIFKPRSCLQVGDKYKTKPELAVEILQELKTLGFQIKLVLAVKDELGWADFRLTDYASIEHWWKIIFSAYLLVSLKASYFQSEAPNPHSIAEEPSVLNSSSLAQFSQHPWWEPGTTWKSALNNLRLIIQPYVFYCLISPWLQVFKIPGFQRGFLKLINFMNHFRASPATFAFAV